MIYPTIDELTKGEYNRYQLAIATAKCARLITDEYVKQRAAAESTLTNSKEGGGSIASLIDQDLADKKAVKNAIDSMNAGKYVIVNAPEAAECEDADGAVVEETHEAEAKAEDETED
jgi:hypothetical protein